MSTTSVKSALISAFVSNMEWDSLQVQVDNVVFTPPTQQPWASLWFLPNEKIVATLGNSGDDELTGVFQINLHGPAGDGSSQIDHIADFVERLFTIGTRLTYANAEVSIRACGRTRSSIEDGWYVVPISVYFRAVIPRVAYAP